MKTKRSLVQNLLLPLLFLLTLPAMVQAQFTFTTNNDGSLNIYQYTGSGGAVTIPGTTNGLPITSIGTNAFDDRISLTSVTIGTNVTSIGEDAFASCRSLTSITIPDSVTNIGDFALSFCFDLTNVTIGTSVTSIGEGAFYDCFKLTSVAIPDSVTNIGEDAFNFCNSLTNATIGTNVTTIGDDAFDNCTSLTNLSIPDSITNIGENAFFFCTSLTEINVNRNNSAYSSVAGVLFNIGKDTLIQYPIGNTNSSYTIPDSVTSIGDWAFFGTGLTSVMIGTSVTNIGEDAFYQCTSLTSVYFVGNAPTVDSTVFSGNQTILTIYYLPGTTGWPTFNADSGLNPAVPWNPQAQNDAGFGVQNNQFGFNITGPTNATIVVEANTNLSNPVWTPVSTNILTGGTSYFSDPQWTNYPGRYYRFSSP